LDDIKDWNQLNMQQAVLIWHRRFIRHSTGNNMARKIISTVGLDIHIFKGYKKMTDRLAFV
jgi:hypothetical protein